jgi:hypothetical protein
MDDTIKILTPLPLAAIYRLRENAPGFGFCLFRMDDGRLAVQSGDEDEVFFFTPANTEKSILIPIENGQIAAPGDRLLYAYQRADLSLAIGYRDVIEDATRADLPNVREIAPFLWLEISHFIKDEKESQDAEAVCAGMLKR